MQAGFGLQIEPLDANCHLAIARQSGPPSDFVRGMETTVEAASFRVDRKNLSNKQVMFATRVVGPDYVEGDTPVPL